MEKTRGFITIATGKEYYYKLAVNMLNSYRYACKNPLPFAIIAEEENEYTKQFDDVIIIKDATKTWLDKFKLFDNIIYDEMIYIETDFLVYGNLNRFFDDFKDATDFSMFGDELPLDTKGIYFSKEGLGDLENKIAYIPNCKTDIIYMRKGDYCYKFAKTMYNIIDKWKEYKLAKFFVYAPTIFQYDAPISDDVALNLTAAVMNAKLVKRYKECLSVYPSNTYNKLWIYKGKLSYYWNDVLNNKNTTICCHFGTSNTLKPDYIHEVRMLNFLISGEKFNAFLYSIKLRGFFMKRWFINMPKKIKKGYWSFRRLISPALQPIKKLIKKGEKK